MEARGRELVYYTTANGKVVVRDWLRSLADPNTRTRIRIRLDRLEDGNLGDHRAVGEGIFELRMDFGPGYRIYIGQDGERIVVLLCGGDKGTQFRDVRLSKEYWQDYKKGGKAT